MSTRTAPVLFLLLLLGWAGSRPCLGRPVELPSLDELWSKADLVAVLQPLSTTNATDRLTSAGPKYGPRNPGDYRAMNTRCRVLLVMKTSAVLPGWQEKELTLLHFCYAPSVPEFNGGNFVYFPMPPAKTEVVIKGDPARPLCLPAAPEYMAFLVRAWDGRFHPVTGHYDSEPSFRIVSTPSGGAWRYALDQGRTPNPPKPKDPGRGLNAPASGPGLP